MNLAAFLDSRCAKRFSVRVMRCNRWDVYPKREPAACYEVVAFTDKWITDALAEQHPMWRVASPIVLSVTELEGPVSPFSRVAA